MVNDADRKALRELSKEYAKGELAKQEYRKRRSALLDGLSDSTLARAASADNARPYRKLIWFALGVSFISVAVMGILVFA